MCLFDADLRGYSFILILYLFPTVYPVITVYGFTVVWKPDTNKEIDEFSKFFENKVVQCSEDDRNVSLNNEIIGKCVVCAYSIIQ